MSQEKVIKTLASLGLTQMDAKVYVFLAKKGPIKARDAAKALKISKQRLYPILKNLQAKGIVNSTLECPARFSAIPFEKMLDLFIRIKMEEAQRVQRNKDEILSDWQSISIAESDISSAQFTVIEGRHYVYSKIQQMIQETKNQLSFVTTIPSLARADASGLFDAAFKHPLKSKVRFRFITEVSEQNAKAIKELLKKKPKTSFNLEGKAPDLGLKLCPRMVIRDEEETLFFIDPSKGESGSEQDDVCLWTNCSSLVHAFLAMFEDLWHNSTDIEKKIVEIETGKPAPKTYVITDSEMVHKKYREAMCSAEEEIVMMTSSKGLVACCNDTDLVSKWAERGVSIKIMAPITTENLESAQQLLKYCEVRHVPIGYLGTTIVDGQYLFQFKKPSSEQEKPEAKPYFENAFYSDDPEYVNKTKTMLNDIWKNAYAPSAITLASILRPSAPKVAPHSDERSFSVYRKTIAHIEDEKMGLKTEKEVLAKFINAQKYAVKMPSKDVVRAYCCTGQAIIHPPNYFNLPDMMIHLFHVEKQSSFGAEDGMLVNLWLKTPAGHTYVPVAMVQDNPRTTAPLKAWLAGTPAEHNVQLFKKDQIQIQVRGNTLFAGWTSPIPLINPYTIPPSCIIFEGYGNIKTGSFTSILPSGYKFKVEGNGFDAFVTFIHPSSKYTGPGTDGYLWRDAIMDIYPP